MSKNYFGLLDSRNTKYQGVIREDQFDGIGILIDDQLTTVLTSWKKHTINGPSVIIFPTLQIFFGQLNKGSPQEIICLQLCQKQKLLIKFQKDHETSQSIVSLIALISLNQEVTYLQKTKENNEYKIIHNFYSKNEDELLKNLSRVFGTQIKKQQICLQFYLRNNFVDQMDVFQLSGGKQMFFGFKGTNSLGFKLQNNIPVAMGFWNLFPRNLVFGKKIYYNHAFPQKTKIQQGNFEFSEQIFTWTKSKGPSIECVKSALEYFKKSTTFRNDFTRLDQVKKLYKKLKQVQEKVKIETSKKYGQTLLENNYGSSHDKNEQVIPKEYTLEQVKEEIYKAAAKKHPSFKSVYKSPYQSSLKKQSKYTFEDSNRSRGSFREQYRVNEFNLSYHVREPIEKSIYKEQSFQAGNTTRYIKDATYNKIDLLKNVDQIIRKQKQTEQMLLNQLMKKDQIWTYQKSPFRQNEEYVSPITNKYRRYQPRIGTNEKQLTHLIKTRPQIVEPASGEKRQDNRINPIRKIKYLQAEKENRPQVQSLRYQQYTIGRTQTGKEREKRENFINYSANQSQQCQSKSHSNLAKYKQRLKQYTPGKEAGINRANRYSYLDQNSKQAEDQVSSSEKLMNQLKLFDKENQNKSKLLRSYTDNNNNYSPHKERLNYMPSEPRQKLRTINPSNKDKSICGYAKNRTNHQNPLPKQTTNQRDLSNNQTKFTKMFSFQDRTLSEKINQNPQILQQPKKNKRTFHYVQ